MGKLLRLGLVWGTLLGVVTAFFLFPGPLPQIPGAKTSIEETSSQEIESPKEEVVQAEAPDPPAVEKPVTQPKPVSDPHYSKTVPSAKPQEEIKQEHKNKTLKNININFFGIENGVLQMLTVYSINKENGWKSGTVFVPTDGLVPGTKNTSFAEFYQMAGPLEIKKVLAQNMEIDIAYYVMVDRNLLLEI
ncbi:MAG: hypothetical protein PHY90_10460 [Desulfitobacteriaceae bacterium]|nr:hypothetical protein [Desulfitobacteriaceae bacterium]